MDKVERAVELVFAIGHEVGNHLGGIRLQAHLLDDELDAREMAAASVAIDDLAGRSGPLLALLRPLLTDRAEDPETGTDSEANARNSASGMTMGSWSTVLGRVRQQIEDEGMRGIRFSFRDEIEDERPAPSVDWLHPLLISLVETTIPGVRHGGAMDLSVNARGTETVLTLEDEGEAEELDEGVAHRGRPLVIAIARELLGRRGGRVDTVRAGDRTRVELAFGPS